MKTLFLSLFTVAIAAFTSVSLPAHAGNCDKSWGTASDGSRCGGRAADVRPGGK